MRWVVLAVLLAGCGGSASVTLDDAWIRLPAVPGRPAAAYFAVHGGATDATLVKVSTMAQRVELHESMAAGMRAIRAVPVGAGANVTFAPGGRHAMIFGLDPILTPGKKVEVTARFADGHEVSAMATVVGAADPAP